MCQQCGCVMFIQQGPQAVLARARAIVKEMGVTADNVQRFEDGERICHFIASKLAGGEDEEVRQLAEWVAGLHQRINAAREQAWAQAARESFANLPAKAPPREVITTWHQLEQLCRELDESHLSSLEDATTREAIRAVQHVHDDNPQRRAELLRRYNLEGE